jgi:cell division protein FtsL
VIIGQFIIGQIANLLAIGYQKQGNGMREINWIIFKNIMKLVMFFGVIFSLLFCVTWQSIHLYLINLQIEELTRKRNELEKTLYLKNIELSSLKSRERISKIALEKLEMIPITYNDVKLIIY